MKMAAAYGGFNIEYRVMSFTIVAESQNVHLYLLTQ